MFSNLELWQRIAKQYGWEYALVFRNMTVKTSPIQSKPVTYLASSPHCSMQRGTDEMLFISQCFWLLLVPAATLLYKCKPLSDEKRLKAFPNTEIWLNPCLHTGADTYSSTKMPVHFICSCTCRNMLFSDKSLWMWSMSVLTSGLHFKCAACTM